MFKLMIIVAVAVIACASAKPHLIGAPLAYSAPLVAAGPAVVTAHSSQVVARNYNGFAAPLVAAPVAYSAYSAPLAYHPYAAAPFAAAPYASVW